MNSPASDPSRSPLSATARALVVVWVLLILAFPIGLWIMRDRWIGKKSSTPPSLPLPKVHFTEISEAAGVKFTHFNGAAGERLLPETMGGGCAFFDYDQDGDQDLLLVNSAPWPWTVKAGQPSVTSALFENGGLGHFTNVTEKAGLALQFYGMGCAVGDFDNDGFPDLYLSGVGGHRLWRNEKGRFRDMTSALGAAADSQAWGTSAAWIDFDRDGDLDLFVCNYVRWSREIDLQVNYQLPALGRAYGPPLSFSGSFPYLYRNEGQGRFSEVSAQAGLQVKNPGTGLPMAKSLGVSPVDLDEDGWIDLVVANDTVQNFVFHNQRNGTFKEMGAMSGIAFDRYGGIRGAMGIDAARFQNENTLGISIGNFANEMTALYVAKNDPLFFTDEAMARGIGQASRPWLTFGVFFFDLDLDGWLDLLTVNGHVENEIEKVDPGQRYLQAPQLFWNSQKSGTNAGFIQMSAETAGNDLFQPLAGRGSAYADIDGDGDLDFVITQVGGPARMYRNDLAGPRRWARLKLVGTRGNREAIGAAVRVRTNARTLLRSVMPTRGYLSQSELPLTIGLGEKESITEIEIQWPDGTKSKADPVALNQTTVIRQK